MGSKWGNKNQRWLFYVSIGCVCITFYVFLTQFSSFMKILQTLGYFVYPVFLGMVIAYVLSPFVRWVQETVLRRVKNPVINRNASVVISFILILLLLLWVILGLGPQVFKSVVNLITNMGSYTKSLQQGLNNLREYAAGFNIDISEAVESVNGIVQDLTSLLGRNVDAIISTSFDVGKGVLNFLIAIILAIYLLCDKFPFQQNSHRFLKAIIAPGIYENTVKFLSQCNDIMTKYIYADLLDALIVGIANFIFMQAFQMPYAALISIVVGVTNLAPTFGPVVGCIIGMVILVLVNPMSSLFFLLFTLCLQTVDGYVLKPKLFGDMLGVSSVWILASIIIGGRMLGVLGILIAIPIAAILSLLFMEYVLPILEERRRILNEKGVGAFRAKTEAKGAEEASNGASQVPPEPPIVGGASVQEEKDS